MSPRKSADEKASSRRAAWDRKAAATAVRYAARKAACERLKTASAARSPGIEEEVRKLSAEVRRLRFRTMGYSVLGNVLRYKQCYVFLFLFLVFFAIGYMLKPSAVSIPSINRSAPEVDISADRQGVNIYNISSILSSGYSGSNYGYPSYSIEGKVSVPRGKSTSVYIDIYGAGRVALPGNGWSLTTLKGGPFQAAGSELARTFGQGISELNLYVNLGDCHCVAYRSPYLEATTANVRSGGILANVQSLPPGPPWGVTLSFRQSEIDVEDLSIPSHLSIVSGYPQIPLNTTTSNDWSWPNVAVGYVTAIDLAASANRDTQLFYSGLILGIAGAAFIALIQAFFTVKEVASNTWDDPMTVKPNQQG